MYKDIISMIGTGKIIGFFGDSNFPNSVQGKTLKDRGEAIKRIKPLISALKPSKVYICPETGLSTSMLALFASLGIPYSVVNPYQGYFDNIPQKHKLQMFLGLENSSSVITMTHKIPSSIHYEQKLVLESQKFIINNSDIIISAFGNNPNKKFKNKTQELLDLEDKPVIAISYAT